MPLRLTKEEIRQRLIKLNNVERLHAEQKKRLKKLEEENRELKAHIAKQDAMIERLLVRVEELETKMFGRKKRQRDERNSKPPTTPPNNQDSSNNQRTAKPPRRPNPREEEITEELPLISVNACKHCDGPLSEFEEVVRFIEDIDITALINKALKTVTKLTVERGKCGRCGKWTSPDEIELRGQTCTLGPNIKLIIPYAITVLDQTYQQVQNMFVDFFGITISDAEITRILAEKGMDWRPEYNRIDENIRQQSGNHLDETTWNIQEYAKHCYAWIKTGTENLNVIFKLAISRGKHNAEELLGDYQGVRITDGYSAYANLPGKHQLCWAHLIRKGRELANLSSLTKKKRQHCEQFYSHLCVIYQTMEECRGQPFNLHQRQKRAEQLITQVHQHCQPHPLDPHKLTNLKAHMLDYQQALFTCLTHEGIPSDNNRAERDLRPLVIKRKKSFGSKTEQGAKALEVVLSVIWSTWRRDRRNFWQHLSNLENYQNV